jgi:hypothetical protein
MFRPSVLLATALALSACDATEDLTPDAGPQSGEVTGELRDSDGDGLSDNVEGQLGTDPASTDSDADGLEDGAEAGLGTDPLAADSDGDGYPDGVEASAGSNPNDAEDGVYAGGWPYNPNKDAMAQGDFEGRADEGEIVPRYKFIDQFGDEVDLYDFAQQGKPMIIDLSGAWCYWCKQAAKLIEGRNSELDGYGFEPLHEIISSGQVYWITILDADANGNAATPETVADWYDRFTFEPVPVLADENADSTDWFKPRGYPTMMFVDENMVVQVFDRTDYTLAFTAAIDYAEGL